LPETYAYGVSDFCIDILCHNEIQVLNSGAWKLDVMFEHIMQALNGRDIESLGLLYFDMKGSHGHSGSKSYLFIPNDFYVGRRIVMSANYGVSDG
jgi:hypothetical protein